MEIQIKMRSGKRITMMKGNILNLHKGKLFSKKKYGKYTSYKILIFSIEVYYAGVEL